MMGWAIAVSIFGVFLELCGVFLAVGEIRARATKLREYERRLLSVSGSVDARWNVHGTASGLASGAEPPTLEQRVELLETQMSHVPKQLQDTKESAVAEAQTSGSSAGLTVEIHAGLTR